jgi:hypothetical protein
MVNQDLKKRIIVRLYKYGLPAIFIITFVSVGFGLSYYFEHLPEESIVLANPDPVILNLTSTDKVSKLVEISFPEDPVRDSVIASIEDPELNNFLTLSLIPQAPKKYSMYVVTNSKLPSNYSNQMYESLINLNYEIKKNGDVTEDKKMIDLVLMVSTKHSRDISPMAISK